MHVGCFVIFHSLIWIVHRLYRVLDKVGIEPQVQRIGKYKSAGDSINRTEIADAQREVISSLLSEASGHWIRSVRLK